MAFLNRVGGVLKQTVSKHVTSQSPAPNASLFQAIRSMTSASKLFVGGAFILYFMMINFFGSPLVHDAILILQVSHIARMKRV